jgi:hypothetical protein
LVQQVHQVQPVSLAQMVFQDYPVRQELQALQAQQVHKVLQALLAQQVLKDQREIQVPVEPEVVLVSVEEQQHLVRAQMQ